MYHQSVVPGVLLLVVGHMLPPVRPDELLQAGPGVRDVALWPGVLDEPLSGWRGALLQADVVVHVAVADLENAQGCKLWADLKFVRQSL